MYAFTLYRKAIIDIFEVITEMKNIFITNKFFFSFYIYLCVYVQSNDNFFLLNFLDPEFPLQIFFH